MTGFLQGRRAKFAVLSTGILVLAASAVALFILAEGGKLPDSNESHGTRAGPVAPQGFVMHDTPRPVTDLAFENEKGQALTLTGFKEKTALLNIWATWCVPCREEMPTLDALQAKLGGAGFQVLALSIDRAGSEAVRRFYDRIGIRHLDLFIDASVRASFDLQAFGLPTTLLIDSQGRELGRLVGPAVWDTPEMIGFLEAHRKPN